MADKRKAAMKKTAGMKPRRAVGAVGRIARPRDVSERRAIALDEHSVRVREEIDAALGEARRMREEIAQRIESGLYAEVFRAPLRRTPGTASRSRASRK